MNVSIYAESDDSFTSRGKSMALEPRSISVEVKEVPEGSRNQLGRKYIEIRGTGIEQIGDGTRGGVPKTTTREMVIAMYAEDLKELFAALLK